MFFGTGGSAENFFEHFPSAEGSNLFHVVFKFSMQAENDIYGFLVVTELCRVAVWTRDGHVIDVRNVGLIQNSASSSASTGGYVNGWACPLFPFEAFLDV